MKFGAHLSKDQRRLESKQAYRGLTFTDRGEMLLDVTSVHEGLIAFSQNGQTLRFPPEIVMEIHEAWAENRIPSDTSRPWCRLAAVGQKAGEKAECLRSGDEHIFIRLSEETAPITVSRSQLNDVVRCIVEPWLKMCHPVNQINKQPGRHAVSQFVEII